MDRVRHRCSTLRSARWSGLFPVAATYLGARYFSGRAVMLGSHHMRVVTLSKLLAASNRASSCECA